MTMTTMNLHLSKVDTQQQAQTVLADVANWEYWEEIGLVVAKEYHMAPERYQQLLPEYQRFISLIIAGYRGLGMFNAEIDQIWHSHILSTMRYEEFCTRYYSRFIHHLPQLTPKLDQRCTICRSCRGCSAACQQPTEEQDSGSFAQFVQAYTQAYGKISELWNLPEADGLSD